MSKRMSERNRKRLAEYLRREAMRKDARGAWVQAAELRKKAASVATKRGAA